MFDCCLEMAALKTRIQNPQENKMRGFWFLTSADGGRVHFLISGDNLQYFYFTLNRKK